MLNVEELESRSYDHELSNRKIYLNARENFPKTFENNLKLFSNYGEVIKTLFNEDSYSSRLIRSIEVNEFIHRGGSDQTFREFLEKDEELYKACKELNYKVYDQVSKDLYQMYHKDDLFDSIIYIPWHSLPEIAEIKEEILDLNPERLKNFILYFETEFPKVYQGEEYFAHYRFYKAYLDSIHHYSSLSDREIFYSFLHSNLFMTNSNFNNEFSKRQNATFNFEHFIGKFISEVNDSTILEKIIVERIMTDKEFLSNSSIVERIITLCEITSNRFDYTARLDEEEGGLNLILRSLNENVLSVSELSSFLIRSSKNIKNHKSLIIRSMIDIELIKDPSHPLEWIYSVLEKDESDSASMYRMLVQAFLEFAAEFILNNKASFNEFS